jgi:hypothetical protein
VSLCVAFGILGLTARAAVADHSLPPVPRLSLLTSDAQSSFVRLDAIASRYVVDGATGSLWSMGLGGAFQPYGPLDLHFRIPVHHLDEDEASSETGMGDARVGARVRLPAPLGLEASYGLDLLIPTGNESQGLGHAAWALAPTVELAAPVTEHWRGIASLSGIVTLSGNRSGPRAIAQRRADEELRGSLGVVYGRSRYSADLALRAQHPLGSDPDAGSTFYTLAPSLLLSASERFGVSVVAELPLRPTRRIDWMLGVGLSVSLSSFHHHEHPIDTPTNP